MEAYQSLGLPINIRKTKVIHQPTPGINAGPPEIKVSGGIIKVVEHFPYLGSHLSQKATIEADIQHRICCASTSFRTLRHRVFDDHNLRKKAKVMVYKAVCITTLIYGREAWVTYRRHLKTLEAFHQRYLRKILHIRWEDRCTNTSVLTEANTASIEAMIMQNQLRLTSHCVRMPDFRLPRHVLFSQLTHGLRTRGGQRKRIKDTAKHYLENGRININTWEDMAADRLLWRRSIHQASGPLRD